MLYKKYKYIIYIIELIADKEEIGLGGFSLYLIYTYSLHKAFLIPTCIILDYYS